MNQVRHRPTRRRDPAEDPFEQKIVQGLVNCERSSTSILDSAPSPAKVNVKVSPEFKFPTFSPTGSFESGALTSTRGTTTSVPSPHITIPLFGWVMFISCATLACIAVLLFLSILISDHRHQKWVGRTEKANRVNPIPRMIVVSYRAPPEGYGRFTMEKECSEGISVTGNVPRATQFRERQLQRSLERYDESDYTLHSHLTTIPEDRSLGDLSTLCDEGYIFED